MERPVRVRGVTIAALAGIFLYGLIARAWGTGQRTLSWDEAYHLQLASLPSMDQMLAAVLANPPSNPLYAVALRWWVAVTGTADPLLRLPSVVVGVVTILAVAWLAWELTRERRVVLASALLVAIAPYLVQYGQEATPYAFATLWVTLALAAGWRWRRTSQAAAGAAAIVFSILAVYSHYVAAAVLGLAAIASLAPFAGPRPIGRRAAAAAAGAVVLAWAPWLLPMIAAWLTVDHPRTALPQQATLAELAAAISQYTSGVPALLERVRPVQLLGIGAAGVLLVRGWLLATRPQLGGLRVVLLVSIVLFAGPWIASALSGRWLFVVHLMLPLLPALAVVLAAGALPWRAADPADPAGPEPTPSRRLLPALSPAALALLVLAQVGGLYVHARHPAHGDEGVRELVATIDGEALPTEPVFITPPQLQSIFAHYLARPAIALPAELDLTQLYEPYDVAAARVASEARFGELTASGGRAWLVYTADRDAGGGFLAWLSQQGEVELRARQPIADLYVVELR